MNRTLRSLHLCGGLFALACAALHAQAGFSIDDLHVEGASRLPADAIVRASGLAPGQSATKDDLYAACTRLVDTGLIQSARYRYKPAPTGGQTAVVTLIITEAQNTQKARIQIPGIDEERVWEWLAQNEPLVTKEMPATEPASAYYAHAIERFLTVRGRPSEIVWRNSTEPGGVEMTTTFRPSVLPKVASLRFEGSSAIPPESLVKALTPTALGMEYTEQDFRDLLKYNAGRLYANLGHLRLAFPRITVANTASGDLEITTVVDEGPAYTLGVFEVAGDSLPPLDIAPFVQIRKGDIADWDKVALSASRLKDALGRYGYIEASSEIERRLDDKMRRVDVTVVIEKGRQYKLGELKLEGLDSLSAGRARSLWRGRSGEILNTDYLAGYEKIVTHDDRIRFRRYTRRFDIQPATELVNVVFTFKQ